MTNIEFLEAITEFARIAKGMTPDPSVAEMIDGLVNQISLPLIIGHLGLVDLGVDFWLEPEMEVGTGRNFTLTLNERGENSLLLSTVYVTRPSSESFWGDFDREIEVEVRGNAPTLPERKLVESFLSELRYEFANPGGRTVEVNIHFPERKVEVAE